MYDFLGPQVDEHIVDLPCKVLNFNFFEPHPPFKQFVQCLILADFKHDIDIFFIIKKVLKLANVLMLELAVNFNFTHKLCLCFLVLEIVFFDQFTG